MSTSEPTVRTFDDGEFRVLCVDGEAERVRDLRPGWAYYDEDTEPSERRAVEVAAPPVMTPEGRYEVTVYEIDHL